MTELVKRLVRATTPLWARSWVRSKLAGPPKNDPRADYENNARLGSTSPNPWIRNSAEIGGWLFPGEHEFLWELATRSTAGDIIEIGTWMGKSACIFGGACKETSPGSHVICVDTFVMTGTADQEDYHRQLVSAPGTFYDFLENARRLHFDDVVIPVATFSYRAIPLLRGPFRLAFIDGAHDRENCARDVELVLPLLAAGGVLAVHDTVGPAWPEVNAYVDEVLKKLPGLRLIDTRGTITAFEKGSL